MSYSDVQRHLLDLVANNKLRKDHTGYWYDIEPNVGITYASKVRMDYLNTKLISVELAIKDQEPLIAFKLLSDLYKTKYGDSDYMSYESHDEDNASSDIMIVTRVWVRNNLKILIHSDLSKAQVKYIDLRFEKDKSAKDSLSKARQEESLIEDL